MSSSNLLISSKFRDRLQFPKPTFFTTNISSQSIQGIKNPTTTDYPVYNFSFPSPEKFSCQIVSLQESVLIMDPSILELIGKLSLNTQKITYPSVENMMDIIKGWYVEIEIADTTFFREIQSFNPIDNSIHLTSPFPFVMNQHTITCFISNRSTSLEITVNGNFFQTNDFLYNRNDLVLYNLRTNESRKVLSRKENVLHLESSFQSLQYDDQFFVFYTKSPPKIKGQLSKQENDSYHSSQFGRVHVTQTGRGYKNNDIVILKLQSEAYDSNLSYHQYKVEGIFSDGQLSPLQNLRLVSIGSQVLQKDADYEVVKINSNNNILVLSPCLFKITSLASLFLLDITYDVDILRNKYFFPLLMSNQYSVKNQEIYVQPNNSLLNYESEKNKIRNIQEFEEQNGLFMIDDAFSIGGSKIAVKVKPLKNLEKLSLLDNMSVSTLAESKYQGVKNFMILENIKEGAQSIHVSHLKKENNYRIVVRNVVIPNLAIKNSTLKVYELPYILLNLKNKTQASNLNKNTIHSNNEAVSKSKFILTIDKDNIDPKVDFLKLPCQNCQEIDFDPYDNLEIDIRLPNGKLLEFDKKEHLLPIVANDKLEVVVFFEILEIDY